jgi:putative transposase
MPKHRDTVYGKGHLHLISCSCYQHQPKLGQEKHRDVFVRLLEEVRVKFRFAVVGYVVMPGHFRLLMREPEIDTTANAVEVLQARYRRRYNSSARSDEQVWESRLSDAHVLGAEAVAGRLSSMHHEPVKAGLVPIPEDWRWSSARAYAGLPEGVVTVEQFAAASRQLSSLETNDKQTPLG